MEIKSIIKKLFSAKKIRGIKFFSNESAPRECGISEATARPVYCEPTFRAESWR